MVKLAHVFSQLRPKLVLVAGDFMLDRYTFGKSRRISPEAPVPVIHVESEEERAGGAGNVVLNLVSLGMQVRALGRVGNDAAGRSLAHVLEQEMVDTTHLVTQESYNTPQKTRIIASGQQIVRVDNEILEKISAECEQKVLQAIPEMLQGVDLVAISDYAKGFLTDAIIIKLIQVAKEKNIPVIADPKGKDFKKYEGATVLKPNLGEALAAAHITNDNLEEAAKRIFSGISVDVLMITRSEAGISLFFPNGTRSDHPVQVKEVRDVVGAGDTVLAMLSCAIANKLSLQDATDLCNVAATIAVEKVGCARVTLSEVARRLIELHTGSKIFSEENASALEKALQGHNFVLLELDATCELNTALFRAIRTLSSKSYEIVITVAGKTPDEELVSVLASLKDVDYILLKGTSDYPLVAALPYKHYLFTNQSLQEIERQPVSDSLF